MTHVLDFMVHNITGLEEAKILIYGYAIEYDFSQPTQLLSTMETKTTRMLYLAGQINGTTGYEEAGAQGLMAAINAVNKINGCEPFILRRDQAYIGVMIDDLVTSGVIEPYRMFTSRAEHRLLLRADNADRRLTEIGRKLGVVSDERWARFSQKQEDVRKTVDIMGNTHIQEKDGKSVLDLMRRPKAKIEDFALNGSQLSEILTNSPEAVQTAAIDAAYAGYIEKLSREIRHLQDMDSKTIPEDFDYMGIPQLRHEAKQRLSSIRPANLGQALRVSGITPADVTVISIQMKSGNKKQRNKEN